MFVFVIGGASSGKSQFAESLLNKCRNRIYIATMRPTSKETIKKIIRHKDLRKNKGFSTFEIYENFKSITVSRKYDGVLLESISNVLDNEMFYSECKSPVSEILYGINNINNCTNTLVVVSDIISSDGINYNTYIKEYIRNIEVLNLKLAEIADCVVEVVCSIPVIIKGDLM